MCKALLEGRWNMSKDHQRSVTIFPAPVFCEEQDNLFSVAYHVNLGTQHVLTRLKSRLNNENQSWERNVVLRPVLLLLMFPEFHNFKVILGHQFKVPKYC